MLDNVIIVNIIFGITTILMLFTNFNGIINIVTLDNTVSQGTDEGWRRKWRQEMMTSEQYVLKSEEVDGS